MTWIDAHVHVWTQDTDRYPLAAGVDISEYDPLEFMPEALFEHTRPSDVSRVVLVHIGSYGTDNSIVTDSIERFPDVFRVVGMVDHHSDGVAADMKTLLGKGVTGFRITPGDSDISAWLQDPGFDAMFRTAAETGQAICPLTHPPGVPDLDRMCGEHPDTTVVIDHMTRLGELSPITDEDIDELCALARYPKVHVKVSRLHSLGAKRPPHDDLAPVVRRVVEAFGSERLMWGSDSPYQVVLETYEDSISLVRDRLDFLSEADRRNILNDTAERVFFRN